MSIPSSAEKVSASQALIDDFDILLKQNMSGYVKPEVSRSIEALAKLASPPSNNMGDTYPPSPLFISHCEKLDPFVVQKTKIDWLAFTTGFDLDAIKMFLAVIWPDVVFERNLHGMKGYPASDAVLVDGVQVGLVGYDASHGRNLVSIPGTGCEGWSDEMISVIIDGLVFLEASLTRVDICLDFYHGEQIFEDSLRAYDNGGFQRPNAPRAPHRRIIDESSDGNNLGRTQYINQRSSPVYGRIYEKGLEVFAKMPTEYRDMSLAREIVSGVKPEFSDTWLRLEVEYKRRDKNSPLPFDMLLLDRDRFFAGAFPYYADCLGRSDGMRPVTLKTNFEVDFIKMISHAKRSYGSLIYSMKQLGFTDTDVVLYLSNDRNNDKLVKSGLFAKMKEAVLAVDPDWDIPF